MPESGPVTVSVRSFVEFFGDSSLPVAAARLNATIEVTLKELGYGE